MDPRAACLLDQLVALPLTARLQVVAAVLDAVDDPTAPLGDGRPTPTAGQPPSRTGEVYGRMDPRQAPA